EGRPSSPPGLKLKKVEAAPEPPKPTEGPPRIWMPSSGESSGEVARAPAGRAGPAKTDLERSLEAFSRFDDEVQIIENPEPSAPRPEPRHTFTELELEGDSLLHAVETAAAVGLEQRG